MSVPPPLNPLRRPPASAQTTCTSSGAHTRSTLPSLRASTLLPTPRVDRDGISANSPSAVQPWTLSGRRSSLTSTLPSSTIPTTGSAATQPPTPSAPQVAAKAAPPGRETLVNTRFLDAQLPLLAAGSLYTKQRDWNGEFQGLLAEQMSGQMWGYDSRAALRRFLEEFESHASELVTAHFSGARQTQAGSTTTRYSNLILHIWPDAKHGLWMQRGYRAVMRCHSILLTVPLTATFRHLHEVVTVAAVVPFDRSRPPVYSGDGRSDVVTHVPLLEHIEYLLATLNVAIADSSGPISGSSEGTAKVRGLEVREGLDARMYVLCSMGLLPPIVSPTGQPLSLRRWRYLIRHPPAVWGVSGDAAIHRSTATAVLPHLRAALETAAEGQNARLVELLHTYGVNVCLLGVVASVMLSKPAFAAEEEAEVLLQLVLVEMLARAVRRAMFAVMTADHCQRDGRTINGYLRRAVGGFLDTNADTFATRLLPILKEAFWLDPASSAGELVEQLSRAAQEKTVAVLQRICQLCGLQMMRGAVVQVLCSGARHSYSSLYDHDAARLLSALTNDKNRYPAPLTMALLLPLRIFARCRAGSFAEAWAAVTELVELRGRDLSRRFLNADTWILAAIVAEYCGRTADSTRLLTRATEVVFGIPALLVSAEAVQVPLPAYLYFLRGQVNVSLAHGLVCVHRGELADATKFFQQALRLPDALDAAQQPYVGQLRCEAMMGLFTIAARSDKATLLELDAECARERRSMPRTLQDAKLSDLFGSLFFERGMYAESVQRLWSCLQATEQLLGGDTVRVAEVLNKLAYVCYTWDAVRYGTFCSCVLHRAEAIMVEREGRYSALHLSVVENIIALFIRRGRYVEASQRLHVLRTLPPRFVNTVPDDHPTRKRIAEMGTTLRASFSPYAIQAIQRAWRWHKDRAESQKRSEEAACVLQRIGRAYHVRRLMPLLGDGRITAEAMEQQTQLYSVLTFSQPLITASALFSKRERNWNVEVQQCRPLLVSWDVAELRSAIKAVAKAEEEFTQEAIKMVAELQSGQTRGTAVPGSGSSVVVRNMLFTKVARQHLLSALQLRLGRHLRCSYQHTLTAPVSALVELEDCAYYVTALIPLHHRPQFVLRADGHSGTLLTLQLQNIMHHLLRVFADAGLTSFRQDQWQWIEVVQGADKLFYMTNVLGLVEQVARRPSADLHALQLPASPLSAVWPMWERDRMQEALKLLEETQLSITAGELNFLQMATLALLASARFAAGDQVGAMRLFPRCVEEVEGSGSRLYAAILSYVEGRAWLQREVPVKALPPLLHALEGLKKLRLHAYHGAFWVLEVARWTLQATLPRLELPPVVAVQLVIKAVEWGEPTVHLFETCERFIVAAKKVGEVAVAKKLTELRDARAAALPTVELDRFVVALLERSRQLQGRDGTRSYAECAAALQLGIRLLDAVRRESHTLVELLNNYGLLLTDMERFSEARECLKRAEEVLRRTTRSTDREWTALRKNRDIFTRRTRKKAVVVLRRALTQWAEKRRSEAELRRTDPAGYLSLLKKLLPSRVAFLVVSETTSRVLLADAQTEDSHNLLRKQRRMRNDVLLQQTYGSRVQLFVDKIASASADLVELALAVKVTTAQMAFKMWASLLSSYLLTAHRIERRVTVAEWHRDRVRLKMWHVTYLDLAIRAEFQRAFNGFMAHCVSAEERAWRRVILRNQKKMKRQLGKAIVRVLTRKPKSATGDVRTLVLDEERRRDRLLMGEDGDFRRLWDAFNFGPVVEDADVEDSNDSWRD